ncbi:sensor histidine kinase [Methanosarcina sp.]
MKAKMGQFSAENPNPVICVENDGTVLYSNEAGEPLLHEWDVRVGEKLPSNVGDFVQRVISRNSPEKIEVKMGKRVYLVAFHPLPEKECANIYGFDISDQKELEEKLRDSEEKYRNIAETANEGICIIDDEARVTYANKRLADMLGYTLEEGIGRPIWDFTCEECKPVFKRNIEKRRQGINEIYEIKLTCKDGSPLWALISAKSLFDKDGKFIGSISMLTDITKRKEAEEALANIETARKKEIHHRIKNNLQVISSLLDLQAEKFNNRKDIKDSEVLKAFKESQDRVISMALIHEELYKGGGFDTLDFSSYIEELAKNLFLTYRIGNVDARLSMDLEENVFFNMDTAVPLGIIINERVSNSLKYAFIDIDDGIIQIKLCREESREIRDNRAGNNDESLKSTSFILEVSDNGIGIPESFDLENPDSLGVQLVTALVDQLEGELELKRDNGTEFTIRFTYQL